MKESSDIEEYNFEKIKNDVAVIKKEYPNIDSNPDSHDGSYEYTKFICEKYKNYNDEFSIKDLEFISNMGKLCYKSKTKLEYIDETKFNTDVKQELVNKFNEITTKYDNNEYTLNHSQDYTKFGLFGQGIASLEKNPKFKCSRTFPNEFIKLCVNFIQEKDEDKIYDNFAELFKKEEMGSSGVISQILHCLKPDLFPVFNSVGMKLYKEYLPNNYMKSASKSKEKVVPLDKYIDACRYLERNCKPKWGIDNYRIIDLIPQIQQEKKFVDFSLILNFLKKYAGQKYKKGEKDKELEGKKATDQIRNFFDNLNEFLEKNELKLCSKFAWQTGQGTSKIVDYFWYQLKHKKYEKEPYSLSIFFYKDSDNLYLCVRTETKDGSPVEIFNKSIDVEMPQGFIYEACGKTYDNKKNLLENVDINVNKVLITKQILIDTNNKNTDYIDEIISSVESDLSLIIPNYMDIFNNGDTDMTNDKQPLNQILYGPPGTGKTYNTVVKAMEIIGIPENPSNDYNEEEKEIYKRVFDELNSSKNKKEFDNKEYKILKKEFDKLLGSQIEFITFHQSYSYEEFVEGIKPYIPKDLWDGKRKEKELPEIKYIGKKGIFREICDRAKYISFGSACKIFQDKYPRGNDFKLLKSIDYRSDGIYYCYGNSDMRQIPLDLLKILYHRDAYFEKPKDLYDTMLEEFGYTPKLQSYNSAFYKELLKIRNDAKFTDNFVLIIDEINRGNISKIFGELITLIEEDKRAGADHELSVALPYSGDKFTVPKNLYIIGTMNTSDRSIASVDIALRRRFKFKEMMPKSNVMDETIKIEKIDGYKEIKLQGLFNKLNQRICALLDRDHQIGHSYFIGVKDIEELKDVWFDNVIPLLNEYFYGDWDKLQAILGKASDGSFIKSEAVSDELFAGGTNKADVFGQDEYYEFAKKEDFDDNKNFLIALNNAFENEVPKSD